MDLLALNLKGETVSVKTEFISGHFVFIAGPELSQEYSLSAQTVLAKTSENFAENVLNIIEKRTESVKMYFSTFFDLGCSACRKRKFSASLSPVKNSN